MRNAVREMERRLKLLAEKGVRNIDQFNKLYEGDNTLSLFGEEEREGPLPCIIIIIDELADLMMLDGNNVEESVTRLAQMARAVGIHLVLATQRPSAWPWRPRPMLASVTLSLGGTNGAPSTWRGTIMKAAAPAKARRES